MYEVVIGDSSTSNSPKNVLKHKLPRIYSEKITSSFVSLRSVNVCFIYLSHSNFILFSCPLYSNNKWDQSITKYPLSFVDQSLLRTTPHSSGMSTTMMSMAWWTLDFVESQIRTHFISLMTFTFDLFNYMILILHIWGPALSSL